MNKIRLSIFVVVVLTLFSSSCSLVSPEKFPVTVMITWSDSPYLDSDKPCYLEFTMPARENIVSPRFRLTPGQNENLMLVQYAGQPTYYWAYIDNNENGFEDEGDLGIDNALTMEDGVVKELVIGQVNHTLVLNNAWEGDTFIIPLPY